MRLGQHFMVDEKVLQRVVDSARPRVGEMVLEVGPGRGALTELLARRCSVTAIEKDRELSGYLAERFPDVEVVNADVLKTEWPSFDKCVSNLPYGISKKFILKLLLHDFRLAVLVLQKEFVEKLVARPGDRDYGTVSVCAQLCCDIEVLDRVPKNAFRPQPKVDSRIVRLRKRGTIESGLIGFVTSAFQRRNRNLGGRRVRDLEPADFLSLYRGKRGNQKDG